MLKSARRVLLCAVCAVICIIALAIGLAMPKVTYAESNEEVRAQSAAAQKEAQYAVPFAVDEQSGLGLNINVVKAEAVDDYNTSYSVLDPAKISQMPASRINRSSSQSYTYYTSDIEDLVLDFKLNVNIGGEMVAYIGALKANLESALGVSYSNYLYKFFSVLEHNILRYNSYLNDYSDPDTYEGYFSDSFLNDLEELSQNEDFDGFFDKYGTHIIGSANYGGRMAASYVLVSDTVILNSDVSSVISQEVDFANLGNVSLASIAESIGAKFGVNYSSGELTRGFYVESVGGDSFISGLPSNFEDSYNDWLSSFNSSGAASVLINYTNDGLVPIWDILPASYAGLSDEMETAFETYYDNFESNIISEFKSTNDVDFAGGSGSVDDPFQISNATQLKNIPEVSMNANYILNNNVTLTDTNWVPLGGYYRETPEFNGTLNGNGKTISGLRRTADITEKNHGFYFGLFGCIGSEGVVKDLTLSNVYIHMDGPEVNDAAARVFVGALAGMVHGTVQDVTVNGTVYNDVCTNGIVYAGGLAGAAYLATFEDCTNNADVTSGRYTGVGGGLVGYSTGGSFRYCENTGDVLARCTGWGGHASAAGISGEIYQGDTAINMTTFTSCTNSGKPDAQNYPGGIFGDLTEGEIYSKTTSNIYS